jgi:hypothetical protein
MTSKQKETYQKWKDNVNMSKSELQRFYDSEGGKEAGLSKSEASKQGIDYGRESARWIFKMKDTPVSKWSPTMWRWAGKQNSFISRMSGVQGKLYDSKGRKTRKHLALLIWGHNPEKKSKGGALRVKDREYDKLRDQSGIVTNIDPEGLLDSGVESAPIFKRGGTIAQTPAPKKDRIYGSSVNKQKSAESKESAKDIKFSEETIETLQNKVKEYNESHSKKVSLATLKAVYRRGAGAYSSSHRPTISGGKPNTRNAWAMARVNKFLEKKAGKPVKKAYVQDDDLLENGGKTKNENEVQEYYVRTYADGTQQKFSINDYEKNVLPNLGKGGNILLAPNGKPSNLTPEQWHLVRTPEFKAWFGDWENNPENASKVVDENGEPLVVYHGTTSNFNIFTKENVGKNDYGYFGKGFYFGDLNAAEAYSQTSLWNQIHNTVNPNGRILKCFLNIRKPLIENSEKLMQSEKSAYNFTQEVIKKYDGIISIPYKRFSPNTEYVVFNSNQIKLADGSNTTFDAENPDIRYDEGGVSDFSKVASASSRFRPVETILFNPPLIGTNGAKLISYTWRYEMTMRPNWEGELVGKRVSDWSQAENSAETGRDIVHVYNVQMPDGTIKSVSSESVPILLGFIDREQKKVFGSLATASKTLAKNQMKLAIMEAQAKEYENLYKKFEQEPKPPIEIASRSELPYVSGKIFDREIAEKGYSNMIFYKMGDEVVSTDNIYIKSKQEYENFLKVPPSKYIVEQLTSNWISNQVLKAGGKRIYGLYDLRNKVERQKRKLESMLKGEKLEQGGSLDSKVMYFWHGGNLDEYNDVIAQKSGRYEYGAGLYLTTELQVAIKYAKGSRRLYKIGVETGTEISDAVIDYDKIKLFIDKYVIGLKKGEVKERLSKYIIDGKVKASYLNNIILNEKAIKPTNTYFLREFFVQNDIDYELVNNVYGWGETMMVLYNMNKIVDIQIVKQSEAYNMKLEQGGETETKIALPDTYASEESLKRVLDMQGYELSKKVNQSDMEKTNLTISEVAGKHSVPVETLRDELIEGIKTEMEHTNNPEEAKKIALDHLAENPQYYQYLQRMESKMKQETIDKHYDELTTKYSNGGEISAMYSFRTPTGEPTRLSYIQQVLVRTSQFKNWFGDWEKAGKLFQIERQKMSITNSTYMSFNEIYKGVSNVIDMVTLEPKVVYHGTGAGEEFYQFDVSRESGKGRPYAYFAENREYSQNFILRSQGFLYECFLNIKNPFMAISNMFYGKRETYPYWLEQISIELFYITSHQLQDIEKEVKDSLESYFKSIWRNETNEMPFWTAMSADRDSIFKRYLMLNNFDGIRYAEEFTNNYDIDNPAEFTRAWCIFDAKQVKLADGRNIDFSPFETDIRLADGGNLEPKAETIENPDQNMNRTQMMRKKMGLDTAPESPKFNDGGTVYGDGENTKNAKDGGYFKGKSHANGGIKAINIDTGQIIEVEGNEVIINKRSVSDSTKREFEGEMLTNKEILSKINQMGGGVKFESGGNLHDSCGCSGKKYKFGGETLEDYVILSRINKLSESYLTPEEESINQLNNMLSEIYG